jgi:hypothetical protein
MTPAAFVAEIQGYYGVPYPDGQKKAMAAYLQTVPEDELGYIVAQLFKTYTTAYSKAPAPPDIAVIERAREAIQDEMRAIRSKSMAVALLEDNEEYATPEQVAAVMREIGELAKARRFRERNES